MVVKAVMASVVNAEMCLAPIFLTSLLESSLMSSLLAADAMTPLGRTGARGWSTLMGSAAVAGSGLGIGALGYKLSF